MEALTVYDDGGGDALFVGGIFHTAGGVAVDNSAKWDGANWASVGEVDVSAPLSTSTRVNALAVFDDGGGARLVLGGDFPIVEDLPANNVASWNGSDWQQLANGANGAVLPLNFDPYFELTRFKSGLNAFVNFRGNLDGLGQAQASFVLPSLDEPSLVGLTLHHAYFAGSAIGAVEFASNAVSVTLE